MPARSQLPPDQGERVRAAQMRLDPEFRRARARAAGKASQSAAGMVTRFLTKLPDLTADQIAIVRCALDDVEAQA